jgi:hypothetical protein
VRNRLTGKRTRGTRRRGKLLALTDSARRAAVAAATSHRRRPRHDLVMKTAERRHMFSFSEMENRAFELGRMMAVDGYPFDANPYLGLNPRLETMWIQGHSKMHALHRMAQKRQQTAPVRAVASSHQDARPRHPSARPRAHLRIVR